MRLTWLIVFLVLACAAGYGFTIAFRKKLNILLLGAKDEPFAQPGVRWKNFVSKILLQSKMIKEPYGVVHFFIFWGFIFICLGEIPFILEGLFPQYPIPFLGTNPYFFLVKDVLAALVFVGLIVGLIRRWIVRPQRLYRTMEAFLVVLFIMLVILTEWISTGAKYALEPHSVAYSLDPVYRSVAALLSGLSESALVGIRDGVWWFHTAILLIFLVYIPNSKHLHLIAAPFNAYFGSLKPLGGQIKKLDLEDEMVEEFGVSRIEGYTWNQLLDCFACGECGRCMDNCPANLSGKPLNPKELLSRTLKHHLLAKGEVMQKYGLKSTGEESAEAIAEIAATNPEDAAILRQSLINDVVTEDVLWSCTTCMSCQVQCPVSNEHVNKIIDLRRYLVTMEGNFSPELQATFRNIENNSNPWGVGWNKRDEWAAELNIKRMGEAENAEYLFFVGCAGSFDNRARQVSAAVARIFQAARVNFVILGAEEKCCGEFARRAGNEYLYQSLVAENVELLNGYNVKKIITTCPHCLNTLRNEYPEFGGHYEVIHHTQFINELVSSGKLKLKQDPVSEPQKIVYHDSCYLGRYQQEYTAPRELFSKVPGVQLMEMDRHHDKSFCCGAGGGRMWMEEHLGERINDMRVEQALAKKPQAIGANCPYCITMLEDGIKETQDSEQLVQVVDPAELIVKLI
ncbi:putative iron-sulfur-binding oxidoreductase FadF [bioreactor metagenome]|uniref:CoB--CoM heterodisulfide reductase iron-sulfur subunit D n=2 Tax=root TaxID=1 RepID=A0A098B909_DESHA|nr:(Fe-S)-binding protein [Desulfitobacterium hafniense]MEA5022141.1 (Fe-S)-binding protein [Desulfitobacterium hafniense]CDX04860.1 CoB--CoM heterodisulfide reductase iron-sulfur subunit D [Desulfitobacterium hafniense]